ncbi:type I-E CRISPR-associated protein Cas6/Cse3/CasE [Blastococcus capsensis]|uniref:type I-E CRISPR-associated protein Cas6/Cse3/CasE n=1 Tax=Blastococcus capsensis TaxID=1564163 RepID=UPI00253FED51|nr:type I-E CRISPR-associated protein Cas6/Cse3/CasE [Blastococcus capsensis]MDK3256659.1 type I-E CRISPR-associated protein Cas6/Cse3/CasE [Blastococcus capsensis]
MTTYLSRVELNPQRRAGRGLLGSPQAMHAAVLSAFPGALADRTDQRVLWRLDPVPGAVHLYVVSPEQPDFTHIVEQAGWPTLQTWQSREYDPFLDRLAAGQSWAFRLTANPTRARPAAEGRRSQRFGHVTVAQQQRWLVQRCTTAGFDVLAASEMGDPADGVVVRERGTTRFRRGDGQVTLTTASFEGMLTVTDAGALRATLTGGLGPGKAYGCGLLTLAPVQ